MANNRHICAKWRDYQTAKQEKQFVNERQNHQKLCVHTSAVTMPANVNSYAFSGLARHDNVLL